MMDREGTNTFVSREEFDTLRGDVDELRGSHDTLTGSNFAHGAMLSILAGAAARHRLTADKITEQTFAGYLFSHGGLTSQRSRESALVTFRAFAVDAEIARREHLQRPRKRRSLIRRLFG